MAKNENVITTFENIKSVDLKKLLDPNKPGVVLIKIKGNGNFLKLEKGKVVKASEEDYMDMRDYSETEIKALFDPNKAGALILKLKDGNYTLLKNKLEKI